MASLSCLTRPPDPRSRFPATLNVRDVRMQSRTHAHGTGPRVRSAVHDREFHVEKKLIIRRSRSDSATARARGTEPSRVEPSGSARQPDRILSYPDRIRSSPRQIRVRITVTMSRPKWPKIVGKKRGRWHFFLGRTIRLWVGFSNQSSLQ